MRSDVTCRAAATVCTLAILLSAAVASAATQAPTPDPSAQTPPALSPPTLAVALPDGLFGSASPPASEPADQVRPSYRRSAPYPPRSVRIFGGVEVQKMFAGQSFDATVGSSAVLGYGGGVEVTDITRGLFIRVSVERMAKSGFRTDGTVSNGLALDVGMVPVDLDVGWRFLMNQPRQTVKPYIGGGPLIFHYSETSQDAGAGDNTSTWFVGVEVFAGADFRLSPRITISPEVMLRSLPGAIGAGGASQLFSETNLGGASIRATIAYRFGR